MEEEDWEEGVVVVVGIRGGGITPPFSQLALSALQYRFDGSLVGKLHHRIGRGHVTAAHCWSLRTFPLRRSRVTAD